MRHANSPTARRGLPASARALLGALSAQGARVILAMTVTDRRNDSGLYALAREPLFIVTHSYTRTLTHRRNIRPAQMSCPAPACHSDEIRSVEVVHPALPLLVALPSSFLFPSSSLSLLRLVYSSSCIGETPCISILALLAYILSRFYSTHRHGREHKNGKTHATWQGWRGRATHRYHSRASVSSSDVSPRIFRPS